MDYHWYDFVGNVGVFLILLAYFNLQLGKMNSQSAAFSLLNLCGALFVLISLIYDFNLSAFIIEGVWLIISFVGIVRIYLSKDVSKSTNQNS